MNLNHFLHEKILFSISDLLTNQRVNHYLGLLAEAETWDCEQTKSFQEERLHGLLNYVNAKVPFYREWFRDHGFSPDSVSLDEMPIVNKPLMREEGIERFAAEGFPMKQRITLRSSGSTGEPFTYYESKLSYSVNMAAKLRTWYQAGYHLGDRYMKIANSDRSGKWKQIQDKINHCLYVPFYHIEDGLLETVLNTIEKKKPEFIRSYPGPLYLLAQYRLSHPGYSFVPCRIFTTGSTLYEAYREVVERAFGCDVIDSYSCEGTPNVYETPAHYGYRVTEYYGIIEVLDEYDQTVTDGIGRVVSTDLWNYAHPFLRYDTQDLVEVRNGKIINIIGRNSDILSCGNGMVFTVHNFSHFFLHEINAVEAYQVVRHKNNAVTFRLVVNSLFNSNIQKQVVDFWQKQLGMPVAVELVNEIPLMNNNKHITIIDETVE